MYESPISLTIAKEFECKLEGEILTAVQRYGIEVNRDRLIEALNFDRNVYNTGYEDAFRQARIQAKWLPREDIDGYQTCSNCGEEVRTYWHRNYRFCPFCGAYMENDDEPNSL